MLNPSWNNTRLRVLSIKMTMTINTALYGFKYTPSPEGLYAIANATLWAVHSKTELTKSVCKSDFR